MAPSVHLIFLGRQNELSQGYLSHMIWRGLSLCLFSGDFEPAAMTRKKRRIHPSRFHRLAFGDLGTGVYLASYGGGKFMCIRPVLYWFLFFLILFSSPPILQRRISENRRAYPCLM